MQQYTKSRANHRKRCHLVALRQTRTVRCLRDPLHDWRMLNVQNTSSGKRCGKSGVLFQLQRPRRKRYCLVTLR